MLHYFVEFTNPAISLQERLNMLIADSEHLIYSLESASPFIVRAIAEDFDVGFWQQIINENYSIPAI